LGSNKKSGSFLKAAMGSIPTNNGRIPVKQLAQHASVLGLTQVPPSSLRRALTRTADLAKEIVFETSSQTVGWLRDFVAVNPSSVAYLMMVMGRFV
jgi:hypothetical protein